MSFKTNDCQQLSLDDSFMTLTERERKALEKSKACKTVYVLTF